MPSALGSPLHSPPIALPREDSPWYVRYSGLRGISGMPGSSWYARLSPWLRRETRSLTGLSAVCPVRRALPGVPCHPGSPRYATYAGFSLPRGGLPVVCQVCGAPWYAPSISTPGLRGKPGAIVIEMSALSES